VINALWETDEAAKRIHGWGLACWIDLLTGTESTAIEPKDPVRNFLYRMLIDQATDHGYRNCLDYFPSGASVLDVGIGNGVMIENYHSLIKSKQLKIIGIDINESYIGHCKKLIRRYGLNHNIKVYKKSVEKFQSLKGSFDYILFSMSFMLLFDQPSVLEHIKNSLKPCGEVLFFQTMFRERYPLIEYIKPRLKYLTTVDFGGMTYESDFYTLLGKSGYSIRQDRLIQRKWFKGEYRLIITSIDKNRMNHEIEGETV